MESTRFAQGKYLFRAQKYIYELSARNHLSCRPSVVFVGLLTTVQGGQICYIC